MRAAITRRPAVAASGVTPDFKRPTTLTGPRHSVPAPPSRSGTRGTHTSVRDSGNAPGIIDPALYGNWNASGITPRTVNGRPSRVIVGPGSEGAASQPRAL